MKVIACRISWRELEKEWNPQEWSTKKPHTLGVFVFGLGIFKGCNTLLWKHICYDLPVFRNFRDKPRNLLGVFTQVFPPPPYLFFFLKQTTDRQIDLLFWVLRYPAECASLELLPEPPQNKICYRLHPKHSPLFCFPIIYCSEILKSLFLRNTSYLCHFWCLEGSWLNVIPILCW